MARVSQALIEFANHYKAPPGPGEELIETPRYRIRLQPDFPIPGPNSVSWIRCEPNDVDEVIDEVHAAVSPRHLPLMWIVEPETKPTDFGDRLADHGILPEQPPHDVAVMVLPADAIVESPSIDGLELRDALADASVFHVADSINSEAFGSVDRGRSPDQQAAQERRRQNMLAAGNRRWLLATLDGEPAGSAGLTVFAPAGAILNGGAVLPKFRGQGIYRALLAARVDMARRAGVPGVAVWGGRMSAPILEKLGFERIGWRRFYLDTSTL